MVNSKDVTSPVPESFARPAIAMAFISLASLVLAMVAYAEGTRVAAKPAVIQALQDYNVLIGGWRGIGQPKRGSQVGAWQEKADALWELQPTSQGIRWNVESGKIWKSAILGFDDAQKLYTLTTTSADEIARTYRGKFEDKRLVLESAADDKQEIHRVTLSILNENRLTVLLEKRPEKQSFYSRVAEVAYQREGTRLAVNGSSGPECVVTGGLGTMTVIHKGKTYYVCCTGCLTAFKDDPEGILAEYQKRKAEEKAKAK